MKCKALFGLRLLLGLVLLAVGSGQSGGLDVVVQHIQAVGPRQWLSLMAGSIVSQTPVIARALQHDSVVRGLDPRTHLLAKEDGPAGQARG